MKISIIMPVYLGDYAGSSKNKKEKFERAIKSFLDNTYQNKELVIVSDGCVNSKIIYNLKYSFHSNIKFISIQKQPLFSGNVREAGIRNAVGDIISYLDADDLIDKDHIENIAKAFKESNVDWIYYNDYIKYFGHDTKPTAKREVSLEHGRAGTSCIAHKNHKNISWSGCDNIYSGSKVVTGGDWTFIEQLIKKYPNHKKATGMKYIVCHIPNSVDN
jgi:glycosyltransferase involved in cell wall biosynthesis